jgi:putative transposase
MARQARVVAEGVPHHITQRGNNRQDVFLSPEDRRFYLELLRTKCNQHGVALLGYCLMTNHVHLVAIPQRPDSLARGLGQTDGQYSQWFNRRHRRSGHLWQERFAACSLGRTHLLAALAYVDLNPVRAGLVPNAVDYQWSSAAAHVASIDSDPLLDSWIWSELALAGDWADGLRAGVPDETAARLRQATFCSEPFGDASFVQQMERRAGRPLLRRKPGPRAKAAVA